MPDTSPSNGEALELFTGPELVFGIARPVGTPDAGFTELLESSLKGYGYGVDLIKLSDILRDLAVAADQWTEPRNEHQRISRLMDEGDRLCKEKDNGAAVALLGVIEIRRLRAALTHNLVTRRAYVIDSIKRPSEVTELRKIYGDRFILIGLQASNQERETYLTNLIKTKVFKIDESKGHADELIARDFRSEKDFSQNILKTFPMSDVFIRSDTKTVQNDVHRFVDLLFGNPTSEPPTTHEFGMQLAWTVSTRSPELGLKVGAVIMCEEHVVSMGMNHHPTNQGSPQIDQSQTTIKELFLDTLQQLDHAGLLNEKASGQLEESKGSYVEELVSGALANTKLKDLTEFQPTVHAEMAALIDGLNHSEILSRSTLYVTAYPCHNCAKHILALDMDVVYLEPYPKSRAEAMYGSGISERFTPFTGIAPRRYPSLFAPGPDRKDGSGIRINWSIPEKNSAQPRVDQFPDGVSKRESFAIQKAGFSDLLDNAK